MRFDSCFVFESERASPLPSPEHHFDQLLHWLQLESQAEAERIAAKRLMRQSKDAELTGETLLDLVIEDSDPGTGGRVLVTFSRRNRTQVLPWNRLKVGSPVLLARYLDDDGESYSGVVSKRQRESLQVSLREIPAGESFRIDLAADEISRKRCVGAIQMVREARGRLGELRGILLGERDPEFAELKSIDLSQTDLNPSQQQAVQFGLSAKDVAVVHGPPGTGKTTTIVELIVQAMLRGDRVLACAPSNTAVDNLVLKLQDRGQRPVRLGHPARVDPSLQNRTLDALATLDPNMRVAKEMLREADALFRRADRYTRARPAKDQKRELRIQAKQLRRDARVMERQATEHVLDQAQLVCATTTIDDSLLGERYYDLLVIDEACQSTEPPCWIPIGRSEKVILAGDHCQLPATVISKQAAREGFGRSLMERLVELYGDSVSRMLNVQYRMNDKIMQFSSAHFYDAKLTSHATVGHRTIKDTYKDWDLPDEEQPLSFIDTAGAGWDEETEPDGESKRNPEEARFVLQRVKAFHDAGVPLHDIAVIVPYAAQVRLVRELAAAIFGGEHRLEIDTVDGFQGREKEVVFISLVRSNEKGEIGFLADTRRMNVAMTRAKVKLIIVGDSSTVGKNDFFEALIDFFDSQQAYSSIWQYKTE